MMVMPANAGIHVFLACRKDVDGRDKPGHDESMSVQVGKVYEFGLITL
jgi:hypothetical protein